MKFRCERDTLVEALVTAGRAVTTRGSSTPALMGVRVETAGNHLAVVGTDLDLTVRVEVEAIGLDDGALVAPARLASDIVRSLEPGAVTFEGGNDEVEISAARSRFVVRTYPVEDFPVLADPVADQVQLPASALAEALRQVVRAASNDDARPLLTGVLVAGEADGARLVATDSYRLALRDLAGTGPLPEGIEQILIPARALTELQRLLPGAGAKDDAAATVGFSVSELDATFSVSGVRLTTRLLDGRFPDYRQLIPPGYPNQLRVGKEALIDALRRVRLLVRDNTTPVRLSMRSGSVELTVVSQEVGHASEDVDADYEGEELTVAFNPSYLIDGVEAVLGDEVVLETVDATKPATVRAPEHDDYRYLLMPVRVS
ncbi:MAG TPA: DNA polymerase III subunit beta [Acidimicrobiales bacterium]|nr:DNA polymerase III subunit beta [Acidimicrobiales bacterium]